MVNCDLLGAVFRSLGFPSDEQFLDPSQRPKKPPAKGEPSFACRLATKAAQAEEASQEARQEARQEAMALELERDETPWANWNRWVSEFGSNELQPAESRRAFSELAELAAATICSLQSNAKLQEATPQEATPQPATPQEGTPQEGSLLWDGRPDSLEALALKLPLAARHAPFAQLSAIVDSVATATANVAHHEKLVQSARVAVFDLLGAMDLAIDAARQQFELPAGDGPLRVVEGARMLRDGEPVRWSWYTCKYETEEALAEQEAQSETVLREAAAAACREREKEEQRADMSKRERKKLEGAEARERFVQGQKEQERLDKQRRFSSKLLDLHEVDPLWARKSRYRQETEATVGKLVHASLLRFVDSVSELES